MASDALNAPRPPEPAEGLAAGEYRQILDSLSEGVYVTDTTRQITHWNTAAERLTGYPAAEMLGRTCCDGPLRHITDEGTRLCSGGCPLSRVLEDGQACSADVFLLHRNGHRVPVQVSVTPLRDAGGAIVGAAESFTENYSADHVRTRIAELEQAASRDPLTGLANRRRGEQEVEHRLEELRRYGWSFGVLFLDVDHFKRVNDRWGHEAGDAVLRMVARDTQAALRETDLVCRWGGEEFMAVVLGVDEAGLAQTAEKLRLLVEKSGFMLGEEQVRVTVSIGATMASPEDTGADLVRRADRLMYQSKNRGRNSVSTRLSPADATQSAS